MILGTHNSATGGRLLWWLRPLAWVVNLTSKCQDKSIDEQLEDVFETIAKMKACATAKEPIYFQLYLDRCFWCKQDEIKFIELIAQIRNEFLDDKLMMFDPWIEGTNEHFKMGNVFEKISLEEHYWTMTWGKMYGKTWLDRLPLPKRHARLHNAEYKRGCKTEYLMLDFYGL